MTGIILRLADLGTRYRAVYCDLWGCVHDGIAPFRDAVAALRAFRAGGGRVVLVTNSPRTSAGVVAQLDAMGMPRDGYDAVATSGDCARTAMLAGAVGSAVHHIGTPGKDDAFFAAGDGAGAEWTGADRTDAGRAGGAAPAIARVALEDATGIVVTGLPDEEAPDLDHYRPALEAAAGRGLKLLCANPDIVVDMGNRRLWCAGALARLYEEVGGTSLYFGKPHPPVYDLARRRLEAVAGRVQDADILCVGDGIHTDVHGGMMEGLDTLFVTEGLAAGQFGDPMALDAGLLHPWLGREARMPTYAIGHLR